MLELSELQHVDTPHTGMNLVQQLKDAKANAAKADFAAKLFAHVEGFDFSAALEKGDAEALASHFSAADLTADLQAKLDTALEEKDSLVEQLAAAQAESSEATSILSTLCKELGLDFSADSKPTANDIQAAVKREAGKQAVGIVAGSGADPEAGSKDPDEPSAKSELATYRAMEAGPSRLAYYRQHKAAIVEQMGGE